MSAPEAALQILTVHCMEDGGFGGGWVREGACLYCLGRVSGEDGMCKLSRRSMLVVWLYGCMVVWMYGVCVRS